MELLLIWLAEMLLALLMPVLAMLGSVVGAISAFVLDAIATLLGSASRRGEETPPTDAGGRRLSHRLLVAIATGFAGISAVVLVALIIVNVFFLQPAVRYVFGTIETRTGYAVACDNIDGNLLTGRLALENCRAQRDRGPADRIDISVRALSFNVSMLSLLGTVELADLSAVGVAGSIAKPPANTDRKKVRKPFAVDRLHLQDVRLDLAGENRDGARFDLPIDIEELNSTPFRSRQALFDLLFRSNGRGRIAGGVFEIESTEIDAGRRTRWQANGIPIASLGGVTGGALAWLSSGSVDVDVEDRWQRGDDAEIELDWQLDFSAIEVHPPAGTGRLQRFLAAPLVRYVNGLDGEFPLHFRMVLNKDQFDSATSLEATGLWIALAESAERTWAALLGVDAQDAEDASRVDALKKKTRAVLDAIRDKRDKGEGDVDPAPP